MTSFNNDDFFSLSQIHVGSRKLVELKHATERDRKVPQWTTWIYPIALGDFEWLKAIGLKLTPNIQLLVTKNLLLTSPYDAFGPNASHDNDTRPLIECIIPRWIQ